MPTDNLKLHSNMKGRRSFSDREEERILRVAAESSPLQHLLVYLLLFTGFRSKEALSLRIGQVWKNNKVVSEIGVPPRALKFKRASTRWVPVSALLAQAIARYIAALGQFGPPSPTSPLFRRWCGNSPTDIPLDYHRAFQLAMDVFRRARVRNSRLGLHSFRKRFAHVVYERSGKNLVVTCHALAHSGVDVTERYLGCDSRAMTHAIRLTDWTRRPRRNERKESPCRDVVP